MSTMPIKQSVFPLSKVIGDFVEQTERQMRWNMGTQQIWPTEVYPGYKEINELRKKRGNWYSTGEGIKSIRARIVSASSVGDLTIKISYLDHLRYADMGVGQGTKWEDVDTKRNVKFNRRYIRKWKRTEGKSHRPGLMPEVLHLKSRIQNYLADFYGYTQPLALVKSYELSGIINL